MIHEENNTVRWQGCYFWGDAQVLGYGILKKVVQGKDVLNKNKSLPFRRWLRGLVLFLCQFMRLVLLFLLYHSGKIAIPHYHLFLFLQIPHLVLFKSLQRQGDMSISRDSRVVFWCDRYGNLRLSVLKRADLKFVRNGFLRSTFDLFLSVSFEKLSSWCCNNAAMIASLSVVGAHHSRYQAVPFN